jgi:hypothetical protein
VASTVQIAADRAHHHLARVQPHAYLDRRAVLALHLIAVARYALLHAQRRVASPHRMVLHRQGCPEQRHDAVAHDLVDRAFIVMHRVHHVFEHRIEDLARFLRVAIGQQLHRTFEVGKQHGDLLALALQRGSRSQDAIGQVRRRVGVGRAWLSDRVAAALRFDDLEDRLAWAERKPQALQVLVGQIGDIGGCELLALERLSEAFEPQTGQPLPDVAHAASSSSSTLASFKSFVSKPSVNQL